MSNDDESVVSGDPESMRKIVMSLQGLKYGKLSAKDKKEEKNRVQQQAGIEDDYLAGPLSIESYVVFRVRPLLEMYEKHGRKLSSRLQSMEIAGIVINSMGAVLASAF